MSSSPSHAINSDDGDDVDHHHHHHDQCSPSPPPPPPPPPPTREDDVQTTNTPVDEEIHVVVVSTPIITEGKPTTISSPTLFGSLDGKGQDHHKQQQGKKEEEEEEEEDDDGYHTPTSPRHRIPPATVCPPAPRKRPWAPAATKRRRVDRHTHDFYRSVRQRVELLETIQLALLQMERNALP